MAVAEAKSTSSRLFRATVALTVTQVVHALVPADTDSDSIVGPLFGSILLIASLAALYGLKLGQSWAPVVAGRTGLVVAVGFLLYHSFPWHSPVTNPYIGESVGVLPWLTVVAAVAAGAWTAWEAFSVTQATA